MTENIVKILSCGNFIKGYRTLCCSNPECGHIKHITQACNSRFCPTCGKRATDQWVEKQKAVLPVAEYQHITFTIPKQLWGFFRQHRELFNQLVKAAIDAVLKLAKRRKITVGIFLAIHSFGRDLQWHPHIHLSVTMGGLDKNNLWKAIRFSKKALMRIWKYNVISALRDATKAGLIHASNHLLNQQYNRIWIVHCAKPTTNAYHTVSYIGRYLKRPPLSLSRLKHYDGKEVSFNYFNHRMKRYEKKTYSTDEFITRFTQHIPPKNFRMIRYAGFLANRVRNQKLPIIYEQLDQEPKTPITVRWAVALKKAFGLDHMECLLCKAPMVFGGAVPGMPHRDILKHHRALALRQIINP